MTEPCEGGTPPAADKAAVSAPPAIRFTADEADQAWQDWGFNCGPGALCGVLALRPEQIRPHLQGFDEKRYTNPTMMFGALRSLGVRFTAATAPLGAMLPWPKLGLVRIQWGGRWMKPGVPMAARYRQTHWVGSWVDPASGTLAVFDINVAESGGWCNLAPWNLYVVPRLTVATTKGSDGTWLMTHTIEVQR